ncbi:Hypothetical glycine rich membrane protein DUF1517 [Geitlerinema sp. FC II]|nr:Hypothetical glycine rich membrane protein DUF1517 [Geitlerinema sp. FC II]
MGRKLFSQLSSKLKPILKSLFLAGLVAVLFFSHVDGAFAARSGGRIGGGSFRAPTRSYSPPSRSYAPSRGYPGGGFGFPFLIPFFGFGGGFGGLFSLLIVIAFANFLVRSLRGIADSDGGEMEAMTSKVSVAKVQVGLLAQARELQSELDSLAMSANTETAVGRTQVLQEASLAVLRHPEYVVYAQTDNDVTTMNGAEAKFNQWSLSERSKFAEETLSNYQSQLRQGTPSLPGDAEEGALAETQAPGEYIVVTILAGVQGNFQLPKVDSAESLNQALRQLGGVSSDRLLAVEVLWTPQAQGDTLSADDLMAGYPKLQVL